MKLVRIETTKPMNMQRPPEGLPVGYTPAHLQFDVPEYVAERLIAAGEAKPVEEIPNPDPVAYELHDQDHEEPIGFVTASGKPKARR